MGQLSLSARFDPTRVREREEEEISTSKRKPRSWELRGFRGAMNGDLGLAAEDAISR